MTPTVATRPDDLAARLAEPGVFPGAPGPAEVHETHLSCVFLTGDRAYKLKKPVVLPFVDYGTLERRRWMCAEEVRLNRPLAPGVYVGVRAVRETPGGPRLTAGEDAPDAVGHVVEMHRYAEADTLAERLRRGRADDADLLAVGARLAIFHAGAAVVDRADAAARTAATVTRNIRELLDLVPPGAETRRVLALDAFARAWLEAHTGHLATRARAGLVRDAHGDLRAEHVLLTDPVQVVDCVEFDPALRELDVGDDLAFLLMDLTARGHGTAARVVVDAYRDAGGDPGDDALLGFFAVHRALVRAKVALLRAAELPAGDVAHGHEHAAARDLIVLAEGFAWRARLPLAIILCGVPASGKSTLAAALATRSGLPHLSSDVTRKQLAGLRPTTRAAPSSYSPVASARTYTSLGRRAALRIAGGRGVIVDATFRRRADRDAFAEAFGAAAPVLVVESRVPEDELARRARRRDTGPGHVSDATLDVVLREAAAWEPLDEVAPEAPSCSAATAPSTSSPTSSSRCSTGGPVACTRPRRRRPVRRQLCAGGADSGRATGPSGSPPRPRRCASSQRDSRQARSAASGCHIGVSRAVPGSASARQ